jgi:predicted nucleic acid-binding protein
MFNEKDTEYVNRLRSIFDRSKHRVVSAVTIYEIHKLSLESEGEVTARLRVITIEKDFEVIEIDSEIAEEGARIAHRTRNPMADSLIMATAKELKFPIVTDDPHFTEMKTVWI